MAKKLLGFIESAALIILMAACVVYGYKYITNKETPQEDPVVDIVPDNNVIAVRANDMDIEYILGVSETSIPHNVVVTCGGSPCLNSDLKFTSSNNNVVLSDSINLYIIGDGTACVYVSYKDEIVDSFDVKVTVYHPVRTAEEFIAIGTDPTTMSYKYKLMNDIDFGNTEVASLSSQSIKPSLYFSGVFDGQGYTLKDIVLVKSVLENAGEDVSLFGSLDGKAVVKNLNVTGVKTTGFGGVIASWIYYGSTVENCFVEVTISETASGGKYGGGIAYRAQEGAIVRDCITAVTITEGQSTTNYGAIIGNNLTTLTNCQSIVTADNSLNLYAKTGSTSAGAENSHVYNSISSFYESVEKALYSDIWYFDTLGKELPHLIIAK